MTPLLQLRLWWRRGSAAERLSVLIVGVIVASLVTWALMPTTSDKSSSTALQAGGQTGGAAEADAAGTQTSDTVAAGGGDASTAGGTDTASGTGGATAAGPASGGSGTAAQAGGPSCLPTPSGAAGVTDKTLLLGMPVLDLAGPIGNSAAGQAAADDLIKVSQAVIDDINSRGGVQCRKIDAKFYKLNPINPDGGRAGCLQVIQDHPALVVDMGGFAFPQSAYLCIPQQKIPIITLSSVLESELKKFAPYLASPSPDATTMMRDAAFGFRDRGFFDPAKGFKKLGILEDQCSTEVNDALDNYLAKAGVTGVSKFTFPCPPNGFGSPADMAQAVAQHRRDGVTHVIPLTGSGSFDRYADAAEAQGYRPKYGVTDYQGLPITAASNLKPNPDNFDGAVAMSLYNFGINTTPGFTLDAGTKRCQQLITKAGLSPELVFQGAGGVCSGLWVAEAALKHARSLAGDGILPGLFSAGSIQLAYANPDVTYKAPYKLQGGDTWWPIIWAKDCSCWHPQEPNRRPSYAP